VGRALPVEGEEPYSTGLLAAQRGAQLREIHDYIGRDNREAARRTVRGIFDRAKAYLPEGIGKVTQYSLLTSGDCRQLP